VAVVGVWSDRDRADSASIQASRMEFPLYLAASLTEANTGMSFKLVSEIWGAEQINEVYS